MVISHENGLDYDTFAASYLVIPNECSKFAKLPIP